MAIVAGSTAIHQDRMAKKKNKQEAWRNYPTSSRQTYYSHDPPGQDNTRTGLGNKADVRSAAAAMPSSSEAYDNRLWPGETPGAILPPAFSSRPGLGTKANVGSTTDAMPLYSEADYTARWTRSNANSYASRTPIDDSPPPTFRSSPPPTFRSSPPPAFESSSAFKAHRHPTPFAFSPSPPQTRRSFPPELNLYYITQPDGRELRYIGAVQDEPLHAVTRHRFHRPYLTLHRDVTNTSERIATLDRVGKGCARVWTS